MRAKHFRIEEFVPEHIYTKWGEQAWWFIDDRLISVCDRLRERHGPMVINTWYSDKLISAYMYRDQSGLRTQSHYATVQDYINSMSQHKFGRAADALFRDTTASVVRKDILNNPQDYPEIKGIENDIPWLHVDVRNSDRVVGFKKYEPTN